MTPTHCGRRFLMAALAALVVIGQAARAEINVIGRSPTCGTFVRRFDQALRRATRSCERKAALAVRAGRTSTLAACVRARETKLGASLQLQGCRERGREFQSQKTFLPMNHVSGHEGNLIHADPDDPSTTTFVEVSPSERTLGADGTATFTVSLTRTGEPATVFLITNADFAGTGFSGEFDDFRLTASEDGTTLTVSTQGFLPPGEFGFYVRGLVGAPEHKWTQEAFFTVIVPEPETAPPVANTATVTIEHSLISVFPHPENDFVTEYALSGSANQAGALFDNENDHIVNVESGDNSLIYPRFPLLSPDGSWSLPAGRRYSGNSRLIVWANLDGERFVAAHINIDLNTGNVSPELLVAGNLSNGGVVISGVGFALQLEGETPTSTSPGRAHGLIDGVATFLEPFTGTLWADRIIFEFDVPLLND